MSKKLKEKLKKDKETLDKEDKKTMEYINWVIFAYMFFITISSIMLGCIFLGILELPLSLFSIAISIIFAFLSFVVTCLIYINSTEMYVQKELSNIEILSEVAILDHKLNKIEKKLEDINLKLIKK